MKRLGVRTADEEVLIATDFSPTVFMLEELVSLGIGNIAVRKSLPEAAMLSQMPTLLRRFVRIVDDTGERDTVARLLDPILKELSIGRRPDGTFRFPKSLQNEIREAISRLQGDLLRLALGYNNSLQVGVNPQLALASSHALRNTVRDGDARAVLALFEGILRCYEALEFQSARPRSQTPHELVRVFGRLLRDPLYQDLSSGVQSLAKPESRASALAKIVETTRSLMSRPFISKSWDYVVSLVKVWSGLPLPDAGTLLGMTTGKSLPILVDLTGARRNAVAMWQRSYPAEPYVLQRKRLPDDVIQWLPPLASARHDNPDSLTLTLGTVGELLGALTSRAEGCGDPANKDE